MPNSRFFRERLQAYADNIIASLLIVGGSVGTGLLIRTYGPVWGLDPATAIAVAWVIALTFLAGLSLLLKPKENKSGEASTVPGGINFAPQIDVNPHIEVNTGSERGDKTPEPAPAPRPAFKVTVPVTSLAGLVRLDVNVLKIARGDEEGIWFPVLAEFENLPSADGEFSEIKDVWAQIIYREFDFLNVELARASTGCWIDQPVPDIQFPLRTPRYLMLGGWHVEKGKGSPNEFRIFEYSRELHRATEKDVKIAGPQEVLVGRRRIVVDVALTSNGHHGSSCAYQFHLTIFGPCGYSINCVKRP
jgi:hypothetical protein